MRNWLVNWLVEYLQYHTWDLQYSKGQSPRSPNKATDLNNASISFAQMESPRYMKIWLVRVRAIPTLVASMPTKSVSMIENSEIRSWSRLRTRRDNDDWMVHELTQHWFISILIHQNQFVSEACIWTYYELWLGVTSQYVEKDQKLAELCYISNLIWSTDTNGLGY